MTLLDVMAWEVRVWVPGALVWATFAILGAVQLDRYLHRRRMDALVARSLDGIDRGKVES